MKKVYYIVILITVILFSIGFFLFSNRSNVDYTPKTVIGFNNSLIFYSFAVEKTPPVSNVVFEVKPNPDTLKVYEEIRKTNVFYENGNTHVVFSSNWRNFHPTVESVVEKDNKITVYISEEKNNVGKRIQIIIKGKFENIEIKDLQGNDYYVSHSRF